MRSLLNITPISKFSARACLLGGWLLLVSCGGGGLIAGVGSGGTGVVEGIVLGFGSVFIDGKEYATTTATVSQDDSSGVARNSLLKLGQRVRATIDSSGATVVTATVIPALSGPIAANATQDGSGDWWISVAGQWVHIVSAATHTPLGLTTVLNGPALSSAGNLSAGNEVEVHGVWSWDAAHNANVLVASRVEVLSPTPLTGSILVGGVVVGLPSLTQVQINAATNGTILQGTLPAGIAVGQTVSAWVSRSTWTGWSGGATPLAASPIASSSLGSQPASSNQKAQLSGLASNYNATNNTAVIQGTTVTLPAGTRVADGDYLKVTGQVVGGEITQATIEQDNSASAPVTPQPIQVLGTTNGINWSAGGTIAFVLQGTSVSAPMGTYASCANLTASGTETITATGYVSAPGQPVVATSVTCAPVNTAPAGTAVDYHGTIVAGSVSAASNSLLILNEGVNVSVTWNASTYLDPGLGPVSAAWSGQSVEVVGTHSGSTLLVTSIRLARTSTND